MTGLAERLGTDVRLGTFVKLPAVETVELMAVAGLDLVTLDLEHSPLSIQTLATMLAVARGRGIATLVRLPSYAYEWVQRALDAGADGLLVPHVDNGDQAAAIMRSARFPPTGMRGMGPTTRAGNWGLTPVADYVAAGDRVPIIGQIESREGVEAVDAILDAGLTGVLIGPADLSQEMGVAPSSAELEEACNTVLAACRRRGVRCGIAAPHGAAAAERAEQGFDFFLVGNDCTLLGHAAQGVVRDFRAREA